MGNDSDDAVRRMPAPWQVEEKAECFVVRDADAKTLAYVYFRDARRLSSDRSYLTRAEARRVAAAIARIPG